MGAEGLDALLSRLRWTVVRPLAVHLGGDETSLLLGQGMDLSEVREYRPGDDVRRIDWNATARTGGDPAYIRVARTERALDVWMVVDVSASMHWGTALCLKDQLAMEFVAVASELLGRHGNRLGGLCFAGGPLALVPLGTGRAHILRLLTNLQDAPSEGGPGPGGLGASLKRIQWVARRPSVVVVVSDFICPSGWQASMAVLARRHDVVAVAVSDPRERELPDAGVIPFEDAETGEQLLVDTGDRGLRERYRRAAEDQVRRLETDLKRCGVQRMPLTTGESLLPQLVRLLQQREQQARSGTALLRRTG